jgi:DNA-binding transcriptional ArsR family regulator
VTSTADPAGTDGATGWKTLTADGVSSLIDTLLDLPSTREFNESELAAMAGVSRNTVGNHIDTLEEAGFVTEVPHAPRYRVDSESEAFRLATKLDVAVRDATE